MFRVTEPLAVPDVEKAMLLSEALALRLSVWLAVLVPVTTRLN